MSDVNKLFGKNMNAIKKKYPAMENVLSKKAEGDIEVGIDDTYGKRVLYAIKEGETYQLDTLYDTDSLMDLWFQNLPKLYYKAKVIMFGLGNGMYIRKLIASTSDDITLIVYEPRVCILQKVMEEFDISDLILCDRVVLLLGDAMDRAPHEYLYELLDYTDIDSFVYKAYLNYNRLFPEEFKQYMKALQTTCSSINATQDVIGRYGKIYYENTFANMKYFMKSKSFESLVYKIPTDVPAIVVAAGPSLDKNVKQLQKAKGKAFIIAVDTALRPLIRNGIIPDICISIDGTKKTAHFADDISNDIPLICYLYSHKEILAHHRAEKIFINDLNHHIHHFLSQHKKILPVVASGGSVANDAFSVVQIFGFKTIILVGQDLALTDNKSHADATLVGELGWRADRFDDLIETEGIDGKPILTKPEYELYARWFEEQIIEFPDLKVIDATEGGAKIKGTLIQTLEETIAQECNKEYDFSKIISQCDDFLNLQEQEDLIVYIKNLPVVLEECRQKAMEAVRCYDKMIDLIYQNKYHTGEFKKLFERASGIGNELDDCPEMHYVRNRIQQKTTEVLKEIFRNEDDERSELIAGCQKGKDYIQLMVKEMDFVIPDTKEKASKLTLTS